MAVEDSIQFWDEQAPTFDDEPDHDLRSPSVRDAWRRLLLDALPAPPAAAVDVQVTLETGDASMPDLAAKSHDAIVARHVGPASVKYRRAATPDHTSSTTPNGHAPERRP